MTNSPGSNTAMCGACTVRPTRDDGKLCDDCTAELGRVLRDLPAGFLDLLMTETRQARVEQLTGTVQVEEKVDPEAALPAWLRTPHDRMALPATPFPFHAGAANLRRQAGVVLGAWAEYFGYRPDPAADRVALAPVVLHVGHLLGVLDRVRVDPEGPRVHGVIIAMLADIDRVVDLPEPTVFLGVCDIPSIGLDDVGGVLVPSLLACGVNLFAAETATAMVCPACGAGYDVQERREALLTQAMDDQTARPKMIAAALSTEAFPVTFGMVWNWINRGYIIAAGVDDRGKPVYRVGDVRARVDLLAAARVLKLGEQEMAS